MFGEELVIEDGLELPHCGSAAFCTTSHSLHAGEI